MTHDFDPTTLLELVADRVPDSDAPVADVLAGGRRLERRHRRRTAALAVASVLVVVGGGLVVSRLADEDGHGPDPVTSPPSSMTKEEIFSWAEQLPRGEDARVAYIVSGHILVSGDRRVDLGPGVQAQLVAPLAGGWLALVGDTGEFGNWVDIRHGFLGQDGSFRPFSFEAPRGSRAWRVRGEAASPDGSQVVYDGTVVDVATGRPVESIPGRPLVVTAWTTHGIEYAEAGTYTPTIWQPGDGTTRIYPDADGFEAPDVLVDYGDRCTGVLRLDASGNPQRVARLCGEGLAAATGSGPLVTTTGRVLSPTGHLVADLDAPLDPPTDGVGLFGVGCCSFAWENDATLLVTFHRQAGAFDVQHLFVRCRLDEGTDSGLDCERASGLLTDTEFPVTQGLAS